MKKALKHLLLGLAFTASLTLVLHAARPDASHVSGGRHDCVLCQVVTVSDVPVVTVAAPHFQEAEAVLPDFVVVISHSRSLLADPRGPPLS
jgi:hypothetical protein